jgi:uroporphyrinogen-III synthase
MYDENTQGLFKDEQADILLHDCPMQATSLDGKRILLTRAEHQLDQLSQAVCESGAIPVRFPCLSVQSQPKEISKAISQLDDYSDVVFTSINGVRSVVATVGNLKSLLQSKRIAAVGIKTANALHHAGVEADILPDIPSQDGLIQAYLKYGLPRRLMFFRAREGRNALTKALKSRGIDVLLVPAYRTVCPQDDASEIIAALEHADIDAVLLGSSKAARFYVQRIGDIGLAGRPKAVAISKKVAEAARDAGLDVQIVAKTASFGAMLNELAEFYKTTS